MPRRNVDKAKPAIGFTIQAEDGETEEFNINYDWNAQRWDVPQQRRVLPGLVIYARFDGSFAVWDPARVAQLKADTQWDGPSHIFLSRMGFGGVSRGKIARGESGV